ncbi:MAG TPA: ADOP family duplicated permease [Acidobacteriota bacterium]|nr:ADOP family duplicated permease [Acidobacteriota bacterium]
MRVRLNHERLAEMLAESRMSQNRWAIRIGVSRSFLSMLVNGQRPYPGVETRRKLLRALDVPFEELFRIEAPARGWEKRRPALWAARTKRKRWNMRLLAQDLRFAMRILGRRPAFAALAVLTLTLGIAASTTIFCMVNGVLLRPLPYPEPHRLLFLTETLFSRNVRITAVSYPNFKDWQRSSQTLQSMAAWDSDDFAVIDSEGRPHSIEGMQASGDFFKVLGVPALEGRTFGPQDDLPGAPPTVVISHHLWQQMFGGDADIVGRSIRIDGEETAVLGVMPRGFRFSVQHDLWVPLRRAETEEDRPNRFLEVIARMAPGVSLQEVRAEMNGISRRLAERAPSANADVQVQVLPLRQENVQEDDELLLTVLLGVVLLVLLIACANVTNLALARVDGRRRELAVRGALGAGRGRLISQLLSEAAFLSLLAGLLALPLAWLAKNAIQAGIAGVDQLPVWMVFDFDANVLLFALAISLLSGILFGLVPALRFSRVDGGDALRESSRTVGWRRGRLLGQGLVAAEVALCMTLVVGAALLMQGYLHKLTMDLGFAREGLLTLDLILPQADYPEEAQRREFVRQLVERARSLPGVEGVSGMSFKPLLNFSGVYFHAQGHPVPEGEMPSVAVFVRALPDYFETLGTELLRGRSLQEADGPDSRRVAVVNRKLAETFWPGEDAVGRQAFLGMTPNQEDWVTIVGVAEDAKIDGLKGETMAAIYVPWYQSSSSRLVLTIKSEDADSGLLAQSLRRAVWEIDPNQPVLSVQTMGDIIRSDEWEYTLFGLLFAVFAGLAMVLALVGLYGVVAYSVSQRRSEIGIRMALGARGTDVRRMMLRAGMAPAFLGMAVGLLGALGLSQLLTGFLLGVSATDPLTFAMTAAALLAVAAAAAYLPARRATRVDPLQTLRSE